MSTTSLEKDKPFVRVSIHWKILKCLFTLAVLRTICTVDTTPTHNVEVV